MYFNREWCARLCTVEEGNGNGTMMLSAIRIHLGMDSNSSNDSDISSLDWNNISSYATVRRTKTGGEYEYKGGNISITREGE